MKKLTTAGVALGLITPACYAEELAGLGGDTESTLFDLLPVIEVAVLVLGVLTFIRGLACIHRYTENPEQSSISQGLTFIMAALMLLNGPALVRMVTGETLPPVEVADSGIVAEVTQMFSAVLNQAMSAAQSISVTTQGIVLGLMCLVMLAGVLYLLFSRRGQIVDVDD